MFRRVVFFFNFLFFLVFSSSHDSFRAQLLPTQEINHVTPCTTKYLMLKLLNLFITKIL